MVGKNRFVNILIAAALLAGAVACTKPGPDTGNGSTEGTGSQTMTTLTGNSINGTSLAADTDLAGCITDIKSGAAIEGVAVSDGFSVVMTDANGVYQMKRNPKARKVYYSTPSEYKVSLAAKQHLPVFYCEQTLEAGKKYRVDFGLEKLAAPEKNFTLVMIGDPQCGVINEVGRYKKETVEDIKAYVKGSKYPNAYAVTLGDVTFDSKSTFTLMRSSMANCSIDGRYLPFFQCIGNHDHDSTKPNTKDDVEDDYVATSTFEETFGPANYSFNRGDAHIIVMDNIIVSDQGTSSHENGKTWNYSHGLTDAQIEWLRQDVACVKNPESKLFILCMHAPIANGSFTNKDAVLDLASKFNEAHLMIGHTHYPRNYIHANTTQNGRKVYEHIHQAACGAWWSCNSCTVGAPNGYNVYSVTGNTIKDWVNKATKKPETYQVRVYNGDQVYTGSKKYSYQWCLANNTAAGITAKGNTAFKNAFIAEIWDDDSENWKVELWQNGAKVGDFKRIADGQSCNIAFTAYAFNELGKKTDTWAKKTVSHFWYYVPASKNPAGETGWEVRATQTFPGGTVTKVYTANKLLTDYSEF